MAPKWSKHLWWILCLASLISLISWILHSSDLLNEWILLIVSIALIAILNHFRILLGEVEVNLGHAITLILGIALNPGTAGIALMTGFILGELIFGPYLRLPLKKSIQDWSDLEIRALEFSRHALSLFGGLALYRILGGESISVTQSLPPLLPTMALMVGFPIIFLALHWLTRLLLESRHPTRRENITLVLVAILPIPYAILSAVAIANFGLIAFIVFGGVLVIIGPLLRNLSRAERDLHRRLEELSTISFVSQAMRTTLDLDALLTTIYLQVAHLLQVDNFYIALISPDKKNLSYPLAVKDGRRVEWPSRPLADRLTDNVIITNNPILIREEAPEILREMGFPELDNPPHSWLGVPLHNPERTLGCIGVFHTKPGKKLSEKDQEILITLAGQASVAIDNALLYDQTSKRAQALALLNEITSSISSTLDPERALKLVNESMIRVGGGQKSAIYLVDQERQELFLARASHLSDSFIQASKTISLNDYARALSILEGETVLIPDISKSQYPESIKTLFAAESIRALAEIPLSTHKGIIGQLAVYFTEIQKFQTDQVELLEIFASQAAIAVSNARAHAETDMALKRQVAQLSTIEAIGRQMVTTLDLDELFTMILDHALQITDSEIGHLTVFEVEANGLRVAAQRGCAQDSKAGKIDRISSIDQGAVGRAFRTAEPQMILDISEDPQYIDWSGTGSRSILSVPITRKGRSMGVITIESPIPGTFSAEQEQILTQLAAQAAIALSNAWLYQELEDHLREQALLFQAGKEIATSLKPDAVAYAIVDNMAIALSADGANLYRYNSASKTLHPITSVEDGQLKSPVLKGILDVQHAPALYRAVEQGFPFQFNLSSSPSDSDLHYLSEYVQAGALLLTPLAVGDEVLGIIEVISNKERVFKERELRTARTIANQAAVALKNIDLFRQIQENQASLMAVLNASDEGILMADPTGRIAIANHHVENLIGIPLDALLNSRISDSAYAIATQLGFSNEEIEQRLASLQTDFPLLGMTDTYELTKPRFRTIERTEAPVKDSSGGLIGWLIILRDISKKYEWNEARNRLTEMIVHDFRSPLAAILSSLKILGESTSEDTQTVMSQQALSVARRSCDQMLGLVNSLSDIAKLETGQLPIRRQEISFQNLFSNLVASYVPAANELGILLNCHVDDDIPTYYGDEDKIKRVLLNLLDNALRFSPPGGQVRVQAEKAENNILFTVSDTGPGIPYDYRERIFDRFIQVPGIIGRGTGTGLGLSFSKLSVEAHGGKIWVEDNPVGGSVFCIQLPLSHQDREEKRDV
jgi:NtrC-family two-component system sensor histidine kinase KinB